MKYRKKPGVIDAVLWTGKLTDIEPLGTHNRYVEQYLDSKELAIHTLEGVMIAEPGDYIIKGIQGEIYPCKPDIFEATYESVETKQVQG